MPASRVRTIPLDRLRSRDWPRVGTKAANLGELIHAGMAVPPGFVVPVDVFRRVTARTDVPELVSQLASSPSAEELAARAALLRQRLSSIAFQAGIVRAVEEACRKIGGPVAVRSSSTAEDLASASFAGQQETFLGIAGTAAVLDAIRACWASLYTDRAVAYRRARGIDETGLAMAVIIQQFVPASRSGVVFTANPVTGDRSELIVNAVAGLGDALVGGQLDPDQWVIDRATRQVKRTLHGMAARRESGVATPPATTSLSADDLAALIDAAVRTEDWFGSPQDIEWAFDGESLYLLQARPITGLPALAGTVRATQGSATGAPSPRATASGATPRRWVRSLGEPFDLRLPAPVAEALVRAFEREAASWYGANTGEYDGMAPRFTSIGGYLYELLDERLTAALVAAQKRRLATRERTAAFDTRIAAWCNVLEGAVTSPGAPPALDAMAREIARFWLRIGRPLALAFAADAQVPIPPRNAIAAAESTAAAVHRLVSYALSTGPDTDTRDEDVAPIVQPADAALSAAESHTVRIAARMLVGARLVLCGAPASPGRASGVALLLSDPPERPDDVAGRVLVVRALSAAWTPALLRAAAVVADTGDVSDEPAAVMRELRVPAVLGVAGATRLLANGSLLYVDGSAGVVLGPRCVESSAEEQRRVDVT